MMITKAILAAVTARALQRRIDLGQRAHTALAIFGLVRGAGVRGRLLPAFCESGFAAGFARAGISGDCRVDSGLGARLMSSVQGPARAGDPANDTAATTTLAQKFVRKGMAVLIARRSMTARPF